VAESPLFFQLRALSVYGPLARENGQMAFKTPSRDIVSNDNSPKTRGLEALYRHYRQGLRRYVQATFGAGPPDPDDVVQAAFERFAQLDDQDAIQNPHGYLVRAARNYVIDHQRRVEVRERNSDGIRLIGEVSDDWDAERVISAREELHLLERAIQGLDERRRKVLIMNRIHGISCARIGEELGIPTTTVKDMITHAIAACERALSGDDEL
jgi:RNA polymerase sigma-70 factor (ECF subfamily)